MVNGQSSNLFVFFAASLPALKQRVDKRRECGTRSEDHQGAKYQHHNDDWKQPELLSDSQELPNLS
jgi:hypothetical protein